MVGRTTPGLPLSRYRAAAPDAVRRDFLKRSRKSCTRQGIKRAVIITLDNDITISERVHASETRVAATNEQSAARHARQADLRHSFRET